MGVMLKGLLYKYNNNDMRDLLLVRGDHYVAEGTGHPRWGTGVNIEADEKSARDVSNWKGLNLLGLCLMQVRDWALVPEGKICVRMIGSSHVRRYGEHVRKGHAVSL